MKTWTNTQRWIVQYCDTPSPDMLQLKKNILNDEHLGISYKGRPSPLHLAASGSNIDIISTLINYDAPVNCKDHHGTTPLHWACLNGNLTAVKLLIKKGADYNIKDDDGQNALFYSVQGEHYIVVEYLVKELQVNLEKKTRKGQTSLSLACEIGDIDIIKLLCVNGANIFNTLSEFVQRNEPEIVRILVQHGKLSPKNFELIQRNPLHEAILNDSVKISTLLIKHLPWLTQCPDFDGCKPCDLITVNTNPRISSLIDTF